MADVVILPEQTLAFAFDEGYGAYAYHSNAGFLFLTEDETYTVVWDGTDHICKTVSMADEDAVINMIGNTGYAAGEDNGIPFLFACDVESGGTSIFALTAEENHTIAIYQVDETPGVIVKDRNGTDVEHIGASAIRVRTTDGGTKEFINIDEIAVAPDMYIEYSLNDVGEVISAKMHGFEAVPRGLFAYMDKLESVDLSESPNITAVGDYAFYGCSALETINLPANVTSIGANAFYGCSALTSIDIPEGVTSIGNAAFLNCTTLKSVNLPDSLISIGDQAFQHNYALTSINLPDGLISIGRNAFFGCSTLTSIDIPEGVTSIGNAAFSGCSAITSIDIPEGVTSIGNASFQNCTAITSIDIPEGVTSIGANAFSGCSALTRVTFKDTTTWYRTGNSNYTGGTAMSVSDASTAATHLTSTYKAYYWYKK